MVFPISATTDPAAPYMFASSEALMLSGLFVVAVVLGAILVAVVAVRRRSETQQGEQPTASAEAARSGWQDPGADPGAHPLPGAVGAPPVSADVPFPLPTGSPPAAVPAPGVPPMGDAPPPDWGVDVPGVPTVASAQQRVTAIEDVPLVDQLEVWMSPAVPDGSEAELPPPVPPMAPPPSPWFLVPPMAPPIPSQLPPPMPRFERPPEVSQDAPNLPPPLPLPPVPLAEPVTPVEPFDSRGGSSFEPLAVEPLVVAPEPLAVEPVAPAEPLFDSSIESLFEPLAMEPPVVDPVEPPFEPLEPQPVEPVASAEPLFDSSIESLFEALAGGPRGVDPIEAVEPVEQLEQVEPPFEAPESQPVEPVASAEPSFDSSIESLFEPQAPPSPVSGPTDAVPTSVAEPAPSSVGGSFCVAVPMVLPATSLPAEIVPRFPTGWVMLTGVDVPGGWNPAVPSGTPGAGSPVGSDPVADLPRSPGATAPAASPPPVTGPTTPAAARATSAEHPGTRPPTEPEPEPVCGGQGAPSFPTGLLADLLQET
jgi:hypothetical protein